MYAQAVGTVLLLHGVYSSYEWHNVNKLQGNVPVPQVPTDITCELGLALLLIIVSTIISQVRSMHPVRIADLNSENTLKGKNEYSYLEIRPRFQNIQLKRKEYLAWRKQQE
ncbi:hypothetical protein DASB73_016110 [Starmerella bacillaris]|uniref:Membrane magnesium transporter n=1 Tax=Starmerella bacillaris TaxID=1247836 RepID=A0AAV5RIT9_STABA|nr:hypothetical protein DASB73_016110 [Starmerella bacillaris]